MSFSSVPFDTLAYANKLKEAGVPDKQAEAQSEALAHIFDYKAATKKDLQELETRLSIGFNTKISSLESKIDTKVSDLKVDVIKWVVGLLLAQYALIISAFKFFH
jgi:hypothetical protein